MKNNFSLFLLLSSVLVMGACSTEIEWMYPPEIMIEDDYYTPIFTEVDTVVYFYSMAELNSIKSLNLEYIGKIEKYSNRHPENNFESSADIAIGSKIYRINENKVLIIEEEKNSFIDNIYVYYIYSINKLEEQNEN